MIGQTHPKKFSALLNQMKKFPNRFSKSRQIKAFQKNGYVDLFQVLHKP